MSSSEQNPAPGARLLEDGVTAALAGEKPRARRLLTEGLALDPNNETGWLWLAGVAESPEDAARALETVLNLNPANDRARAGLRATRLSAAQAAMKDNDPRAAWRWLSDAARADPNSEEIWLALAAAGAGISPDAAVKCLNRVLEINPANDRAKAGLAWYKAAAAAPTPPPAATPVPVKKKPDTKRLTRATITWACPVCDLGAADDHQICPACGSLTTLRPPAAFARHRVTDPDKVSRGVELLAAVPEAAATFETYRRLGIALLNQQRFADAMAELQAALALRPTHDELPRYIYSLRVYAEADRIQEQDRQARSAARVVMVVDDSPTVRKVVSHILEKAGYRTIPAQDGAEALLLIREHGVPAVFLVDVMMPGMDGFTLCKTLRQNPDTARTPVVMLSGKDGLFNKVRGRMVGANQYLTKPFDPGDLVAAIKTHAPPAAAG